MQSTDSDYAGLAAVTVETSAELVYTTLRSAITNGVLVPGQRLVETRLAERIGVSRAPLREAIRMLEAEGLLTSLPKGGVIVSVLEKDDVEEIYGLRIALERWAVREACRRATDAELEHLIELVDDMKKSSEQGDIDLLSRQDVGFHRHIAQISGNKRLLRTWLGLVDQIQLLSLRVIRTQYEDLGKVPRRHSLIARALRDRQADVAERLIHEHIQSVAAVVLALMPQTQNEPSGAS